MYIREGDRTHIRAVLSPDDGTCVDWSFENLSRQCIYTWHSGLYCCPTQHTYCKQQWISNGEQHL